MRSYWRFLAALAWWSVTLRKAAASALLLWLALPVPLSAAAPTGADRRVDAAFPLKVAEGKRYLEDSEGKPFLLHGDTAWSLIAELNREDAEAYFQDRRARGFNTLLVSLIEYRFATKAPANIFGDAPFIAPGDFSTPNDAYFAHAEWVLQRARELGFLVLLTPAYIGARDAGQGWYPDMVKNGNAKLRDYGRFVGRRFGHLTNIVWVAGGDDNPRDKSVVRAVVEGIAETMPQAMHTAHCRSETSAADLWSKDPWLKINNAYTYGPVYNAVAREYWRIEPIPTFLIESTYEDEHNSTEQLLRMQAYSALLAGGFGQVFGNNPIWHFSGPGLFPTPKTWRDALGDRGSVSMTHLQTLFSAWPWWRLEPDFARRFVISGIGKGEDRLAAAIDRDRQFAIVYLPGLRAIDVDLGRLSGRAVEAQWYDPSAGTYAAIEVPALPANGVHSFKPSGRNAAGFEDWVLLLTAR